MHEKEKDDHEKAGETSQSSTTGSSRRDFLKGSIPIAGAGLAAAAMPGLAAAPTSPSQPQSATQDQTIPSPKNPLRKPPRRRHQPAGLLSSLGRYQKPQLLRTGHGGPAKERDADFLPGEHPLAAVEVTVRHFHAGRTWER